jgi:hypothetical protein
MFNPDRGKIVTRIFGNSDKNYVEISKNPQKRPKNHLKRGLTSIVLYFNLIVIFTYRR